MADKRTTLLLLIFTTIIKQFYVNGELIDMSYPFENNMAIFPGLLSFNLTMVFRGPYKKVPFASSFNFKMNEHVGTHIDAPFHFIEKGIAVDEILPENLIGKAIVLNITEQVSKNCDYEITVEDLNKWEKEHGKIPDGCILFVLSGIGKYWGDYEKYMGISANNNDDNFHWPGFHKNAAQWLVDNRKLKGIGVDMRSFDIGPSEFFHAHQIFLGNNIYGLESVANIEKLPVKGAVVYVMPMKIKGGSGGPTRIIADTDPKGKSNRPLASIVLLFLTTILGSINFM